jgi:hypothetical protein
MSKTIAKNGELALAEVIDAKKRSRVEKQALAKLEEAKKIKVKNDATYKDAADFALSIKSHETAVAELFDDHVKRAHELHKGLTSARKAILDPLAEARRLVQSEMGKYGLEQRRLALEQAERDAKAQREAEIKQAQKDGDKKELRELKAAPIVPLPVAVATPKVQGVVNREVWRYEIIDQAKIPARFWVLDAVALQREVTATKGETSIPGIRVFKEAQTQIRG